MPAPTSFASFAATGAATRARPRMAPSLSAPKVRPDRAAIAATQGPRERKERRALPDRQVRPAHPGALDRRARWDQAARWVLRARRVRLARRALVINGRDHGIR